MKFTFIPTTEQQQLALQKECELASIRSERGRECFDIINRGKLWYDSLSEGQIKELGEWYKAWLDVTKTKVKPAKPSWLI